MRDDEIAREIAEAHCGHKAWCVGYSNKMTTAIAAALRTARNEEREACAKVVMKDKRVQGLARVALATAIRARKE